MEKIEGLGTAEVRVSYESGCNSKFKATKNYECERDPRDYP